MRRFYLITRDLYLYLGLFISPFVLLFAVSVFFLVHDQPGRERPTPDIRTITGVSVPSDVATLQGRARIDAIRPLLGALGVSGEVDFVRHVENEGRLVIPVTVPGRQTTVDLNYTTGTATIASRSQSISETLIYLHKTPGPHNADLRGNSRFMRAWRLLADATVYLVFFITLSGIYPWLALRAERRIGIVLIAAGFASFAGLVYVIAR
jgi:hypothetical protein